MKLNSLQYLLFMVINSICSATAVPREKILVAATRCRVKTLKGEQGRMIRMFMGGKDTAFLIWSVIYLGSFCYSHLESAKYSRQLPYTWCSVEACKDWQELVNNYYYQCGRQECNDVFVDLPTRSGRRTLPYLFWIRMLSFKQVMHSLGAKCFLGTATCAVIANYKTTFHKINALVKWRDSPLCR